MEPNRFQQIAALCGEALELSIADRTEFLREHCGDDPALRAEVESLLSIAAKPGLLDSAIVSDEFNPSAVIGGRFRIVRLMGRGGMGEVYQAEDLQLGGYVALKNIRPELLDNSQAVERFKREIQLAKKVTHPNVCRIYDVGFHPSSSDPKAKIFLTMELLEGQTLSSRLTAGPMTTAEALPLIRQMADALGAAHRAGIVHRDFKTGNVMLVPQAEGSRVVVTDFGLARTADASGTPADVVTQTGGIAGTPDYMAPEQLTGGRITAATDIYALGIVIYEMVAGKRPFEGRTPFDVAVRRLHETPLSLRQLAPDLEPHWEAAILRCLSRQPEGRFQDTSELMAALSRESPIRKSRAKWGRVLAVGGALGILALAAGTLLLRSPKKHLTERVEWQQLTDFSDAATDPALSPDGRMLAFKRGGSWFVTPGQVYLKLLPDGQPVQLTHDSFSKTAPVFSPDSTRIVYTVTRPDSPGWESWEASVLPDGSDPRKMLSDAEGITWIDTQHILFSVQMGNPLMGVVTSTESRTDSRTVYVPQDSNRMAHFTALSPDRKQVLVVEMQPGRPLVNDSTWLPCRLVPFDGSSKGREVGPVSSHCVSAAWSPDGRWMYFSARVDDKFHLWRQRPGGGEPEQITSGPTEEEGLAIAPDGRSVITSVGVDQTTVWVHDANGEYQISGEGDAVAPLFAPDGKRVYYRSASDLWATELASGQAERVLPGVSVSEYVLSPDGKAIAYTTTEGSLWYGAVDHGAAPHMLAAKGRNPQFIASGDVFFWIGSILHRVHSDGTGVQEVPGSPGDPKLPTSPLSPDEEWSTRMSGHGKLLAYPKRGGRPVPLCDSDNCSAGWTLDRKFFWIGLDPLSGQNAMTGLIPLKGPSMFPTLPPGGVHTRADLMKLPGAQVVASRRVSLGPNSSSYAFEKQESHWNLYRIPLL